MQCVRRQGWNSGFFGCVFFRLIKLVEGMIMSVARCNLEEARISTFSNACSVREAGCTSKSRGRFPHLPLGRCGRNRGKRRRRAIGHLVSCSIHTFNIPLPFLSSFSRSFVAAPYGFLSLQLLNFVLGGNCPAFPYIAKTAREKAS